MGESELSWLGGSLGGRLNHLVGVNVCLCVCIVVALYPEVCCRGSGVEMRKRDLLQYNLQFSLLYTYY